MQREQFTELVVKGLEQILFEGEIEVSQNFVIFQLSENYYLQIEAS